ncbi:putative transmembrane protein [Toxoplasma gondii MAS]|uniref:Putative transmembrane protein n=1 Tax=Toxoplasma gondii MAS TaxID=943118 RepID=A0A086QY39_TOXGO|nr:putative transmembrane protein [Toxoplasma gondii MAS]
MVIRREFVAAVAAFALLSLLIAVCEKADAGATHEPDASSETATVTSASGAHRLRSAGETKTEDQVAFGESESDGAHARMASEEKANIGDTIAPSMFLAIDRISEENIAESDAIEIAPATAGYKTGSMEKGETAEKRSDTTETGGGGATGKEVSTKNKRRRRSTGTIEYVETQIMQKLLEISHFLSALKNCFRCFLSGLGRSTAVGLEGAADKATKLVLRHRADPELRARKRESKEVGAEAARPIDERKTTPDEGFVNSFPESREPK